MKKKYASNKNFLITILMSIIFGALIGAIIANRMDNFTVVKINKSVEDFFALDLSYEKVDLFKSEFFKNARTIFFLWLMAFIPLGKFFLMLLLFIKGLAYGFTSSILISHYKLKALVRIIKYILPQNLILFPILVFISICNLNFYTNKLDSRSLFEYFFILVISLASVFLAALIQIYLLTS